MAEPISATTAMLLLGGANVGMAALKAQQAARQREMEAKIRAAEIEASPWTGRAPSTQVATASLNPWAEMAGGAINTLGQTAALQQAGLFKTGDVSGSNVAAAQSPQQGMPITADEKMKMSYAAPDFYGKQKDMNQWQRMVNMSNTRTGIEIP